MHNLQLKINVVNRNTVLMCMHGAERVLCAPDTWQAVKENVWSLLYTVYIHSYTKYIHKVVSQTSTCTFIDINIM